MKRSITLFTLICCLVLSFGGVLLLIPQKAGGGFDDSANTNSNTELWINNTSGGSFSGGSGDFFDPYLIYAPEELASVAEGVLNGDDSITTSCFMLMANIDLSGFDWIPIGTQNPFRGCFWGNGFVISGMEFSEGGVESLYSCDAVITQSTSGGLVFGLFGYVEECTNWQAELMGEGYGQISGVVVSAQSIVNLSAYAQYSVYYGAICAFAGPNTRFYKNSVVGSALYILADSVVNEISVVGGMFGVCKGAFISQSFVMIDNMSINTKSVGGMIGFCQEGVVLLNSYVLIGSLNSDTALSIGGLIGQGTEATNSVIKNCYASILNVGVYSSIHYFGGIAGACFGIEITNCFAYVEYSELKSGGVILGLAGANNNIKNNFYMGSLPPIAAGVTGITGNTKFDSLDLVMTEGLPIFGFWHEDEFTFETDVWVWDLNLGNVNNGLPTLIWSIVDVSTRVSPSGPSAFMTDMFNDNVKTSSLTTLVGVQLQLGVVVPTNYKFISWSADTFYSSSQNAVFYCNKQETILYASFSVAVVESYFCGNYISIDGGTTFSANNDASYGISSLTYISTSNVSTNVSSTSFSGQIAFLTPSEKYKDTTFQMVAKSDYEFLGWYRATSNNIAGASQVSTLTTYRLNFSTSTKYFYFAKLQRKTVSISVNLRTSLDGVTWPISAGGGSPTVKYYNNKNVLTSTTLSQVTTTLTCQSNTSITVLTKGNKIGFVFAGISTVYRAPTDIYNATTSIVVSSNSTEANIYFLKESTNKLQFELEGKTNTATVSNVIVENMGTNVPYGYGFRTQETIGTVQSENIMGLGRWYVSMNFGIENSFSMCRIHFNAETSGVFVLSAINRGFYDSFGIFGNLDVELKQDNNIDSVDNIAWHFGRWEYNDNTGDITDPNEVKTISYFVTAGQHFIDVKYIKGNIVSPGEDFLAFKFGLNFTALNDDNSTTSYNYDYFGEEQGYWFEGGNVIFDFNVPDDNQIYSLIFEVVNYDGSALFSQLDALSTYVNITQKNTVRQYVVYNNISPGAHQVIILGKAGCIYRQTAVIGEIQNVQNLPKIIYGRGFASNSDGYFESQNKGLADSYSMAKVSFNVADDGYLRLDVVCDGESWRDYGVFGQLDKTLSPGFKNDNVHRDFSGSSSYVQTVLYKVTKGAHFFYVKYIKNGNGDFGRDSLQFKISSSEPASGGYFYFEDGEYPQSDADKIEMATASPGVYSGVSVDYDTVENVVTLDGQYSNSDSINYFLKTKSFNIVSGRKVTVKIDYLGGTVSGGGRVIIGFGLRNAGGTDNLQLSNSEPSLGQYSFEYINTLNHNVENGYLYFFLWRNTENGGTPTYNKAKFRITLFYDGMSTLLNSSINMETTKKEYSLTYFDGSVNVEIPVFMYNGQKYASVKKGSVSKWFKVEPIRWRVSDHGVSSTDFPSERTDMVTFNTRDGWEIIGQQVSVTANTTYTLKLNCEAPNFNPLAGYLGLGLMVLNSAPTNTDCTSQRIERYQISQNNDGDIEFSFNTGNTTSIYIILNGGYIEDGGSYTFKFRDFSLTGGQADGFKSDVTKWTKYFQSSNITVSKNVSWQNYGAYNTNFTVVSDKVLGFGAVTNQDTKERWSVTESELYKNTLDYMDNDQNKNKLELEHHQTDDIQVAFDKYGAAGQQNKVESVNSDSYMGVRVASLDEIDELYQDRRAKPSDMVAFLMGLDVYDYVDYWTRDLGSNLNNGKVVTKSGIEKSTWLNISKGVRFSMTMKEGSNFLR